MSRFGGKATSGHVRLLDGAGGGFRFRSSPWLDARGGRTRTEGAGMRLRLLVAATLAVLAVLGLAGTSGFAHVGFAKTRVAIRDTGTEGVPNGKFRMTLNGVSYDA